MADSNVPLKGYRDPEDSGQKPQNANKKRCCCMVGVAVVLVVLVVVVVVLALLLTRKTTGPGLEVVSPNELIHFTQGRPVSYKPYTDYISSFLQRYQAPATEDQMSCQSGQSDRPAGKFCRVDLMDLGGQCTARRDYGLYEGQPCVLLKLRRIPGWVPEQYNSSELPAEIRDTWQEDSVSVTCTGQLPPDKDNLGRVLYYPVGGINLKYFPFDPSVDLDLYHDPVVFARFLRPRAGLAMYVECRLWAKNLSEEEREAGKASFELMVD